MDNQDWRTQEITFGQKASITQFAMNPQARKFFDGHPLWDQLDKLNKGQASEIITLIKEHKGAEIITKLREYGIITNDIEIIKPHE